jgi:hypothetical protein
MDAITVDKHIYLLYNSLNAPNWDRKHYEKYKKLVYEIDMFTAEYEYMTNTKHELNDYVLRFYEKLYELRLK